MAQHRREYGRYLMAAFVTVIFVVLAYYLIEQIPHASRPTLVPTVPTTSTSTPR